MLVEAYRGNEAIHLRRDDKDTRCKQLGGLVGCCHQISNITGTKYQNLNVSHPVLQISLCNLSKSSDESKKKLQLEQRRQAMIQLHLSDQNMCCLLRCGLYLKWDDIVQSYPNSKEITYTCIKYYKSKILFTHLPISIIRHRRVTESSCHMASYVISCRVYFPMQTYVHYMYT